MDISVVIPVYGCKAALPELHRRLTAVLSELVKEYEIILVNDACPQGSWQVVEQLARQDDHVVGIELARNFGQIKAITAGLDYCTGEWTVVMDCDLQDRPEEIVNLYRKALDGYDVVFARRAERKDSKFKVFVSNCFYKLYSFATDDIYDPNLCNFSISHRKVVDAYCSMRELHRAFVMYIKWLGFRQASINVEHNERYEGKSGYNFKKRLKLAGEILTSQSDKLLRMVAFGGIGISVLAFLMLIFLLIQYFTRHIASGWTSQIATILLVGGLNMTCIGVVGIYIGNTFMQVKERPLYVVRTLIDNKKNKGA